MKTDKNVAHELRKTMVEYAKSLKLLFPETRVSFPADLELPANPFPSAQRLTPTHQ